ncbi:MAG TPA: ArsA-related P-loop ATPase, partial [Tetrasphaera australiensis]|nr:ArsA-related P-loop ATPase [Tetrasphaera australiensis]
MLFTGKGGVGKTTSAAATAVAAARDGIETLVMSTDAAHSLGDALDRDLGATGTGAAHRIEDHLHALQVRQPALRRFVGRRGRRLRAHRRDAAPAVAARGPALVHGPRLPDDPQGEPGGVADPRPGHGAPDAERQRVQL